MGDHLSTADAKWVEEIPAHWEVKRLKLCASVSLSGVDKKSVEGEDRIRLCNYTDAYHNERINGAMEFMAATASSAQIRRFALKKGDVIITKDSETPYDIAVPAVVSEDLSGVLCGYHLALIRPGADCAGTFLARAIGATGPRAQFHIAAKGITRFGLTADAIGNSVLPIPPLVEQRAIAHHLDRETAKIDALIAKQGELTERLHEKRIALISHAITKGLDPDALMGDSGVEWLGEIPAHWEVRRLKNWLGTNERVLPEDTHPDYAFDYLDIGSVGTGKLAANPQRIRFESAPSRARRVVRQGDTIVSTVRTYLKAVWHADGAVDHLIASTGFAVFSPGASAVPGFVNYLCQSDSFTSRVTAESSGVSYPAIAESRLETLEVSFPPLPEQRAIADHLDRETGKIDALVAKITESIDLLNEYRTALTSAAVTGKIDVRGHRTETAPTHASTDETPE